MLLTRAGRQARLLRNAFSPEIERTGMLSDGARRVGAIVGPAAISRPDAGAQKRARTVPAISHWKPSSAFEILLTSLVFVRCRRAAMIAAPTREATT
jgi:hypothetical protein